ncbi:hypothetical protein DFH08DRAFT_1025648 [Mycena albidolilacea]|uniref:Uncharacterized protein n=1 Tax=Mycena albidolilacea TaxID=1033008 RepID=A0AAD7ANW9_9AGAR|nr:hypothetical protein DFH08DRAFT_1025648 [Mycena albidolilacea]
MANLSKEELQEALKDAQLKLERALQQNGGRKGKPKPSSGLEYDQAIVGWGKKFAVLYKPWITVSVFGPYPADGPPELEMIPEIEHVFKDARLYLRYTTVTLYQNIPAKFYELVDPSVFGAFASDFMKQMSSACSSTLFVFRANFDKILRIQGIERNRDKLLYHRANDKSTPPTAYPPIFYDGLKDTLPNLFLNPVGPLSLRIILFGQGSLGERGKAKPLRNTIGFQWKVPENGLTVGSICFTLILLIFVIADHDENFTETGSISKIPYQKYYRQYKMRFMKYAKTTRIQRIIKFWSGIVFHGIDTGSVINEQTVDDMNDREEAEFALAMERLAVDMVDMVDEEEEDFDFEMGHHAIWMPGQFESFDSEEPAQQEPSASPAVVSSAAPVNPANTNAAQVDAAAAVGALQGGGAGRIPVGGSVGRIASETQGRGQSNGKGRAGRGHGRGRGRRQASTSDDSDEPAPALRRGARRT